MKKSIMMFLAIVLIAGFSTSLMAQYTENTDAGAVIITPISLTETSALHFGVMAVLAGTPGTCVLATDGARSSTGGVTLPTLLPAASNAAYDVTGEANTAYTITLPADITVSNGGQAMTIDNLLAKTVSAGVDGLTGTLSGAGLDSFTIGGTLNVAASQVASTYTGTFDVTVAYD